MTRKQCWITFLFFPLLLLVASQAPSGEIEVKKQILKTDGEIENTTIAHVLKFTKPSTIEYKDTNVELVFDTTSGEFEKSISIAIQKATSNYNFCSFDVKIPFYQENTKIDFVLFGHTITPGARSDIRALRSVDPNTLDVEELFRYYAKSRVQANYVLKNILAKDSITRDNVKAIYSFLQATNNLAKKRYVRPDNIAERSATWLSQACKNNQDTCENAVRERNWKQVLTEYRAIDAYRYEKLYDEVLNLRTVDFDSYCKVMVALQDAFEKMQDDQVTKVNRRKITAQVTLAVSGCFAKAAWGVGYKKAFDGKDKNVMLVKQMLIIEVSEVSEVSQGSSLTLTLL